MLSCILNYTIITTQLWSQFLLRVAVCVCVCVCVCVSGVGVVEENDMVPLLLTALKSQGSTAGGEERGGTALGDTTKCCRACSCRLYPPTCLKGNRVKALKDLQHVSLVAAGI